MVNNWFLWRGHILRNPIQARYQAALHPDTNLGKSRVFKCCVLESLHISVLESLRTKRIILCCLVLVKINITQYLIYGVAGGTILGDY